MKQHQTYHRVVIVGAGFGGLQAAQSLAHKAVEVILIDRHNYHSFIPLLYQVATAQLAPEQVVVPIRNLLRSSPNVSFVSAKVETIDFPAKIVQLANETISYDYLVLATGSRSQFFGVESAKKFAFPLKNLGDAINLRHHILSCCEQGSRELDFARRKKLLTIAIVGGGATGVELAGSLVELVNDALLKDYPRLDSQDVTIILVHSGDRLLSEFPSSLGDYTASKLRRLGVKVMLRSKVTSVSAQGFELDDGTWFASATVIWAVGVTGAIPKSFPFPQTSNQGKIKVSPTLQLAQYPEVFAIGDLAQVNSSRQNLSGVAPEALQQGVYVAQAITKIIQGHSVRPFRYFNKGRLAIIGCYCGVGKIGNLQLRGFLPWLFWLAVHLVYFPNWHNRLMILMSWLHSYIFRDRAMRFIFSPINQDREGSPKGLASASGQRADGRSSISRIV
ncbi:NADH dehydrogenase, FAD-containing subunit [Xenococcus sp. PCC 7305]|uniref:NAD(P)/FAD-dependent oxidoreductase n=1 Tax=Xenococcus sp. PCC 7305 TaxID=102125 RepID=UPI0002AC657E|nr:NAD(P)/FAD-dependent oxidoreductase [Xenococcus sp. PCC 7305]ELS01351.1 NADH dehydrogenase, FAD-containing subunit [Xenococcus sp. PCC 7305]